MQLTWRSRRQLTYLAFILGGFVLIGLLGLGWWWLTLPPACFDGPIGQAPPNLPLCDDNLINPHEVEPLIHVWTRSFAIRPGQYNVVAIFRNPNLNIGSAEMRYIVDFYDANNNLLTSWPGQTFVNPAESVVIFTGPVDIATGAVSRTQIRLDPNTPWQVGSDPGPGFRVTNRRFVNQPEPMLEAAITNLSVRTIEDIEIVAVILDEAGNAITASATWVPSLAGDSTQTLFFTWPEVIEPAPRSVEFYPRFSTWSSL